MQMLWHCFIFIGLSLNGYRVTELHTRGNYTASCALPLDNFTSEVTIFFSS